MKCRKSPEGQTQKQKPTCYGEMAWAGRERKSQWSREQQEYLQQKTEKFHLFSSPDAPTKSETGKRQTDGEKNHVKPGIFISSLVDVNVLWGEIQIKNICECYHWWVNDYQVPQPHWSESGRNTQKCHMSKFRDEKLTSKYLWIFHCWEHLLFNVQSSSLKAMHE